jgi:hypothetical protein
MSPNATSTPPIAGMAVSGVAVGSGTGVSVGAGVALPPHAASARASTRVRIIRVVLVLITSPLQIKKGMLAGIPDSVLLCGNSAIIPHFGRNVKSARPFAQRGRRAILLLSQCGRIGR